MRVPMIDCVTGVTTLPCDAERPIRHRIADGAAFRPSAASILGRASPQLTSPATEERHSGTELRGTGAPPLRGSHYLPRHWARAGR